MTGTNHAVAGALIAVTVKQPALALPLAFISHFFMDLLPHWDYKTPGRPRLRPVIVVSDTAFGFILLFILSIVLSGPSLLTFACGCLAMSPDLMWIPHVIHGQNTHMNGQSLMHRARRWHSGIQKLDSARGLYFEIAWFAAVLVATIWIGY